METKTITIERVFDAPLDRVWKGWTDPEEVKKWFGPKDFTTPIVQIDLRVGGKSSYCMRGAVEPGGPVQDHWSGGVFREVIPMQKIVTTDYFTDEKGNKVDPTKVGMSGEWPDEMLVTVTFEEQDNDKTKLTLVHEGHPVALADMAKEGWSESLDKLAAIL